MRDDFDDNVNRYFMPPRLLRQRVPKVRLKRMRRRRLTRRLISLSMIVTIIVALVVVFADLGSDMVRSLAENYVRENMNLKLKTESVRGNPLKGYAFRNASLENKNGKTIFSAEYLSGHISFSSLIRGRVRLSEIFTQGASLETEEFVSALYDSRHYGAYDEGIFESSAFASDSDSDTKDTKYIPLDRLTIEESKFNSRLGTLDVKTFSVDMERFSAYLDADISGVALRGDIDVGNMTDFASINRADMYFGSGKITAVGGLFNDDIFDFHASAEDLNLKEMTKLFGGALISDDFDGKLNLNFDIVGVKESPRIFGSVDYRGTQMYGLPVERMSANYSYSPDERILNLNNIQASALNIPVQGEMSAMNIFSDDVIVRIRLDGSETNLDGLDEVLNVPELKGLKGKVDSFNANVSGSVKALNGLVNLSAPKIMYSGRTLSNVRVQMKLAQSSTANVDGKFTFEEANGFIQGSIVSVLKNAKMNLTAKIADLDIKRIENIIPDSPSYNLGGKITLSLSVKGSRNQPSIMGSLSSNELSGWSQKVMKPVIDFSLSEGTLKIDKAEGTVNGIPITITGTLKPVPSSNPELDIMASLNDKLKAGIRITGTLNDPSFSLTSALEDSKPESQDIRSESPDIITSTDTEQTISNEIKKEEVSKDENTAN